jgi:hypothetical protein
MADSVEEEYDPLPLPLPPAGKAPAASAKPAAPASPAPSNPGRPSFGSAGKLPSVPPPPPPAAKKPARGSTEKRPPVNLPTPLPPPAAKKPASVPSPPPAPAQEVLSLDDDPAPAAPPPAKPAPDPEPPLATAAPEPAASGDPFAFAAALVTNPKGGSKAKQKAIDNEDHRPKAKSKEKGRDDADADEPEEGEGRRYVRPGAQKSGKVLLFAGVLGLVALGAAIAAVVVFTNKKPAEQVKSTEKKDEPPAPSPADLQPPDPKGGGDAKGGKKESSKTDPPKKDSNNPPKTNQKGGPTDPASGVGVLELPKNIKTFQFRPAPAKPAKVVQSPNEPAVKVEVPFDKVRRFFPPQNRVQDAVVVWQSNPGILGKGERITVDTYSGMTGGRIGRFEYDGDGRDTKCDASADGALFAAVTADGKVSVWNLADKSKPLDGFDPYADKPDHKKAGLAAVFFARDPKNLVTVSTAGAVHLFEVATKKQLGEFVPPNGVPGRVVLDKNVASEENRSSIVVAVGGVIYQVTTAAPLSVAWKLEQGEVGRSFGIAAFGTPGRIAYAFETDASGRKDRAILFCLPDAEPVVYRWQDRAGEPTGIRWAGTDMAVVGTTRGAVWVEAEGKVFNPLAMGEVPGGKALHAATDRAHWYLVPNPADPAKSLMLELGLPLGELIEFRDAVDNRQPLHTVRLDEKGLSR